VNLLFWWWDLSVDLFDAGLTAACEAYWKAEYERTVRELNL
jgi:hypothetical protein